MLYVPTEGTHFLLLAVKSEHFKTMFTCERSNFGFGNKRAYALLLSLFEAFIWVIMTGRNAVIFTNGGEPSL
jgi:hypothetical protein